MTLILRLHALNLCITCSQFSCSWISCELLQLFVPRCTTSHDCFKWLFRFIEQHFPTFGSISQWLFIFYIKFHRRFVKLNRERLRIGPDVHWIGSLNRIVFNYLFLISLFFLPLHVFIFFFVFVICIFLYLQYYIFTKMHLQKLHKICFFNLHHSLNIFFSK